VRSAAAKTHKLLQKKTGESVSQGGARPINETHSLLTRIAAVDAGKPKAKKATTQSVNFDQAALRFLPDTKQIHNRLFTQQVAGDGPKDPNQYQR